MRILRALPVVVGLAGCAAMGRRAVIVYTTIAAAASPNQAVVTIDRSFLESYRDRVTITARFTVDDAMRSPNSTMLDGDLHVAGRAPEIGLRLVTEVKHAASESLAVALFHRAESTHAVLPVTGVWRMWAEHAIGPEQQGEPIRQLSNPNPDHIFEIHPITVLSGLSLLRTFEPLDNYKPPGAKRAFEAFEGAECTLKVHPTTVSFITSTWLENDVKFLLELEGPELVVADGRFLTAAARDLDGNLLVDSLRIVLVKDSPPELRIRTLKPGARLPVWGLPRVSFAGISRWIAAAPGRRELKGKLPYEIVLLGIYKDEQ